MPSAAVTSKGQITLPLEVRKGLGIEPGDRIDFVKNQQTGRYEIMPGSIPLMSLFGVLPRPEKPVTLEEMNETIEQCGARSIDRT